MAWLSVVALIGSAALAWIVVKVMHHREDMASMNSPAWINHLADESRRKSNRKRRYHQWVFMGQ